MESQHLRPVAQMIGAGRAPLDDAAEVVDESRRIIAEHFARDGDPHAGPLRPPGSRLTWYASQRVAFSIAEV